MPRFVYVFACVGFAALSACATAPRPPLPVQPTTAAISNFVETGSYQEAINLCNQIAANFANQARCVQIGTTTQHRPLMALVVSADGVLTAQAAAARRRPVIMVQAGIHAGEIEGKDAGFQFLLAMLRNEVPNQALRTATWVFIPVLNPDGHERISPNNRPNQRGPAHMGFRTTGINLNLNRDYMKADSVELRAELTLITAWHPTMLIDLHTTDGAKFQHDVAVMVSPSVPRADGLSDVANNISHKLQTRLTELGHAPLWFYPSFREQDRPESGVQAGDAPPRFSTGYGPERSILSILVETHSWRTYRERVTATYDTLLGLGEQVATDVGSWAAAQSRAEQTQLAGQRVTLSYDVGPQSRLFEFKGYRISREASAVSTATWTHYDEQKPEIWSIPMFDQFVPAITVTAPGKGYFIDGGFAALVEPVLRCHGIAFQPATTGQAIAVQTFRPDQVLFEAESYEGRQRLNLRGGWRNETRTLTPGALFIPIAQPMARLVLNLFEPAARDALVNWGLFNTAFEQKEYMEDYVAEQIARDMLAANPALQIEFDAKVAADPVFAKSPAARLDFFRRRHPSWDERLNLVPVFRAE